MQKLPMQSRDITAEQLAALRALFPHAFTEARDADGVLTHKIDFDILRQELSPELIDPGVERYQLTWPGKRNAIVAANQPIAKTLRPQPQQSVDFDQTEHLFIEGDNLDALKLLQETYLGKVKLIYIDPPYNTGNDFIYKDDFRTDSATYQRASGERDHDSQRLVSNPESNGRFHSDWLSMMYPRLKLARNLLRDDGVIFISIDDNEVHNLKKICAEIFGDDNFIANIIWQKKYTRSNDARYFSATHDHIICVAKSKDYLELQLLPRAEDQTKAYSNPDNHPKGPWKSTPLHSKSGTNTSSFTFLNSVIWHPPVGTFRRYNDAKMNLFDQNNEIWFGKDGKQIPSRKSFLSEVKDGLTPVTIWTFDEVGHTHEANTELKSLHLGGMFENPKPTRLIKQVLFLAVENDDIVLDFFAGSSTTAHAVMQLNAEDGGNRRYIMVQLPEVCPPDSEAAKAGYRTIAEISKERLRRAGAQILSSWHANHTAPSTQKFLAAEPPRIPPDVGFRVLTVDSSNMHEVFYRPDSLVQGQLHLLSDNIKPDRSALDLLFQVMLDWGVDLGLPITQQQLLGKTILTVADGVLVACFDHGVDEALVRSLAHAQPLRVVFRDSGFVDDATKINVAQIFAQLSPRTDIRVL